MWLEFGEHVKSLLDLVGLTEQRLRWLCGWTVFRQSIGCWCEQRRRWLNDLGESVWEALDAEGLLRKKRAFAHIVEVALEAFPLTDESLCDILSLNMRMSSGWTRRWLDQMAEIGLLSSMNENVMVNGYPTVRVWYSLPRSDSKTTLARDARV